jgi:hypothetical protein
MYMCVGPPNSERETAFLARNSRQLNPNAEAHGVGGGGGL